MSNMTYRGSHCPFTALLGSLLSVFAVAASTAYAQEPSSGDVGRGAKAWSDNCARCHNMRDPKEFRDDQWKVIVMHMRVRGALTGQDARDILAYLQAAN